MLKYSNLGRHKQLNEIVMAGSHDAGITEGGANVRRSRSTSPARR